MAIVFIAILLVLALAHFLPDAPRWRDFAWLRSWARFGAQQPNAALGVVLAIGLPALGCLIVQLALRDIAFGLFAFVFAVAVLFYCLGPRDLERDVAAAAKAPDGESRSVAVQALRLDEAHTPLAFTAEALAEAAFDAALRRVFGAIFWFVLLGPAGALLYRSTQLLAFASGYVDALPAPLQARAEKFARLLDWAPAHLIALALALASNFDAVYKTWRDYHAAHGQGYFQTDLGFLNAIARASVDADVNDVAGGDGQVVDVHSPLVALEDAMTLIRRVLLIWLALIALIVISGVFAN